MRKIFAALVALVVAFFAEGKESQFVVRAFVREASEAKWTPVHGVHVSLASAVDASTVPFKLLSGNDSTKIIDNDSGEVRLLVSAGKGKYVLTLDADGYEPLMKDFEVRFNNQTVVSLPQLSMVKEREMALNEVEVVGTAVKLVVKGDTLVYNANALKLAEGSMLDALIKELDGVELDADGNIKVNGRTVNSLLINGKDFFKGDPLVALENLPAYTVNNVKVYDKAAEDDYLTQSSAKLARREDEENLVMDVLLKKEYNIGYMGSIEGGYGTDNRWLGKLFGLGFSEKWRISTFYNTNNLGDTQRAGANGWRNGGSSGGENTVNMAGADYMFDNNKLRVNGNVTYTRQDRDNLSEVASTQYYNTGDIYNRSASSVNTLSNSLHTAHELMQKWDDVYLGAELKFDWNKSRTGSLNRQASFDALPEATTRVEALDSVFARPFSKKYNDILLSRVSTANLTDQGNIAASGELEATIRTSNMQGRVNIEASGAYNRSRSDARTIYLQHFGGANTGTSEPVNSDRFAATHAHNYNFNVNANYTRDWNRIIDEKWQNRLTLRTRLNYTRSERVNDYDLFTAEATEGVTPSLQTPENALLDLENSDNSTNTNNVADARVQLNFNHEPLAPSASGINPAFGLSASATYTLRNEELDYHLAEFAEPEIISRTKHHLSAMVGGNFSSGNDYRYWNVGASYSNSYSDPSIYLFLRHRTNSDPLLVYENNAANLHSAITNRVTLRFSRFGRKVHNNFSGNFSWQKTDNSVGSWRRYDPNTGITTSRPMNIDGNWSVNGSVSYQHPFGKREQLSLGGNVHGGYNHSVDFQSTVGEPVRSLVRNTNLGGNLSATYHFTNGSNVSLSGGPSWQYATSARERFNKVNAMTYNASLSGVVELPYNIQLRTDMTMTSRRGYEEKAMNTTQWLWNASATKSILRGSLIFKLTAFDILGQIDPVRLTVNAQGRTEAWYNTLPRYGMLTITWRFNHNPGKGGGGDKGMRRGPGGDGGPRGRGEGRMGGGMGGRMRAVRM